ncbi:hypothetical protein J1605_001208 [Eschrichtius robustus]|uniref:Uncharacterized protein n=1 Tax=Eschrichtius robustus TaxID=9764 RepID=A0AB34GDG9_ESCRO|nr:hypothetical protein J1605_001208 [Eschrichtius robustus]
MEDENAHAWLTDGTGALIPRRHQCDGPVADDQFAVGPAPRAEIPAGGSGGGRRLTLVDESDLYNGEVALFGPPNTLYEGGYFRLILNSLLITRIHHLP